MAETGNCEWDERMTKAHSKLKQLIDVLSDMEHITNGFDEGRNLVENTPTADVVEVVHGEWIFDFELEGSNFYKCSVCGRQEVLLAKESTDEYFPYCHCGAKMDGATDNNVGGKQEVQK